MYQPKPLDTSRVTLPPELVELIERLAENTHEVWAAGRLAQGWTYGSARDDAAKKHPGLVPYAELPESEKAFDRQTSLGVLKAVVALGYAIEPVEKQPPAPGREP
ncbi:MAG: RyR domain-containing protein [Verrucomicrobiota bacterium]